MGKGGGRADAQRAGGDGAVLEPKPDDLIFCSGCGKKLDETVHSLLRGEKRDRELLADYLETAGVRTQRLGCFICQVDFLEKYYDEFQEGERELIEKNLPYLLYQMMDGGKGCCLVPDSNNRCICFFEWDEEAPGRLGRMAESVRELFAGDVDFCTIRCGLSARASAESRDIRRIVWEAETALRLAGGQADQNGFIREYDPEQVQFGILFGKKEKNRLVNFLAGGQEQKAHELLEDIVEQNQKAGLHEGLMQVLYGQLYHTGYEFLLNAGSESAEKAEQLWGQVLLMEENESAGGLTALKEFYSACIAMTEKSEKPDNTLEKVFAYITEHFAEGIYLENVAEAVTVSPKYLSRIFKERTGVNLSEYINLVRITRAKELLVNDQKGARGNRGKVGFENRRPFFGHLKSRRAYLRTNTGKMPGNRMPAEKKGRTLCFIRLCATNIFLSRCAFLSSATLPRCAACRTGRLCAPGLRAQGRARQTAQSG